MKKQIKMIIALAIIAVLVVAGVMFFYNKKNDNNMVKIVATNFPGYDFARAVAGDKAEVKMLVAPGAETHNFEPTPQDIIAIKESDLFVYVGGESDEWIDDIIKDIDLNKTKIMKMMDVVDVVEEDVIDGMEAEEEEEEGEEPEYDEHVWTSPKNAIKIVNVISEKLSDKKDADDYKKNAKGYVSELEKLDADFRKIISGMKNKTLIFGDRFPLRYFFDEYGLKYYAAFPGCAEQTEASSKTISFLIDKVKSEKAPVVFKIELSSGKIAETIAKETGAKVVEFNAVHNVSADDFKAGVTYVTLMKRNATMLKDISK